MVRPTLKITLITIQNRHPLATEHDDARLVTHRLAEAIPPAAFFATAHESPIFAAPAARKTNISRVRLSQTPVRRIGAKDTSKYVEARTSGRVHALAGRFFRAPCSGCTNADCGSPVSSGSRQELVIPARTAKLGSLGEPKE